MKSVLSFNLSHYSSLAVIVLSLVIINPAHAAGVALGGTRIIYPQGEKQVSMNVNNTNDKESFLVQSWVSDTHGAKVASFIITPPLFVLKPNKTNVLRIMYNGAALPEDRESVFYFNNKAIPSVEKKTQAANTLQIATQSIIKLFVRPQHLTVKPADAPAMLRCQMQDSGLTISNPSPYFVTLVNFTVGGKKQPNVMIPPLGNQSVRLTGAASGVVSYQTLNDFGAITPALVCKA
ncbi:fimbria/pilus periplasmic chaperone [Enterobacter sp. 118C5]|uniref:fimbria/pilus periplasmic chaperone n=1 Tax=Enterobacter TaxID=547 RepID=UPI002A7FB15B|nr:fimbria/pilus periplasmic chaperone [Enterobacter sp. 118C5]